MRIAIVTAVWKRPEIFKMFAAGVQRLQERFNPVEIICCVAGSEEFTSRYMVEAYTDFFYVEAPNHPLGRKMNAALGLARKLSPDFCLMVGSDDIIGESLMETYLHHCARGVDYTYLLDCYFFDTVTKKGLYWGGYRANFNKGYPLGMGRMISARMLNLLNWVCWPDGYDKVLDTGFDKQVKALQGYRGGIRMQGINLKDSNLFALDIKSSTNMTPFAPWDNTHLVDGKTMLFNNLPEQLAKTIYGK